jgi:predicted ester cyclase
MYHVADHTLAPTAQPTTPGPPRSLAVEGLLVLEAVMTTEKNKAIVRDLVEGLWNEGRAKAIDDYFAPDMREAIVRHHDELRAAFTELRVSIEELIAEGDKVAARLVVTGIHDRGPFAGQPPTGRRLTWASHRFYRFSDGRVVETRAIQDRLGLMQQLGALESAPEVHWGEGQPSGGASEGRTSREP